MIKVNYVNNVHCQIAKCIYEWREYLWGIYWLCV